MRLLRLSVLGPLALGAAAFHGPAAAVPTLVQGPVAFAESVAVTDVNPPAGATSNPNTLYGSTTFQKFDPLLGVLTKVTVGLASSRSVSISGGTLIGAAGNTANGSGSSTARLVLPTIASSFGSQSVSGNCTQSGAAGCTYSQTGPVAATNATINVTNTGALASYVGGGSTFDVQRLAPTLSVTSGGTAAMTFSNVLSTWTGNLGVTYEYLYNANPSFEAGADTDAWVIDFGAVLQGSAAAAMGFELFNLGGLDTVGLDLDTISSSGDDSILTTDLASFLDLGAGGSGNGFLALLDTLNPGTFEAIYTLVFSDGDVGAEATRRTHQTTLTLRANVLAPPTAAVPEPMTLVLLGAGLIGLGYARYRAAHRRA